MTVSGRPEDVARNHGDSLLVKQPLGEGLRVQTGAADRGEGVERPRWFRALQAELAQPLDEDPAAPVVVGDHRGDVALGVLERLDRGDLRDVRGTQHRVLVHPHAQLGDPGGRADPADPPARHRVRLGEATEHDGALPRAGQRAEAGVRAGVGEPVVDLVGDEVEVVLLGERHQRLERGAGLHGAGRVGRRPDQDGLGTCRDRGGHRGGVDGEIVLPGRRHPHRDAAGEPHTRLVGDVAGLGDDHFVAGVEQHPQREVQPFGHPGGDEALAVPGVVGAVALGEVCADQAAQGGKPGVGRVGGVAVLEGVDPGLADAPGSDEIRLTHAEGDHVVHLGGDVEEPPDPRRWTGGDDAVELPHGVTGSRWSGSVSTNATPPRL